MRVLMTMKRAHSNMAGMVQGLVDAGHELHLVTSAVGGTKSVAAMPGVDSTTIPYSRTSRRLWGAQPKRLHILGSPRPAELIRTYRRIAPDVVVAKDLRTMSLMLLAIARLSRTAGVLMWNKPRFARKWPIRSLLAPIFLPRRKIHMGFYGEVGEPLPLGGALGATTLLPYPIVLSEIPDESAAAADSSPVRVVAIGALTNSVKRMVWVSQSIHRLGLQDHVEITYIGLGDEGSPAYQEIRAFEADTGLPPAQFLLNLPHSEVLERLSEYDILAHPSVKENFGAVITEAMAAGLAVLCSDRCGAKVCFEPESSGLVFDSDSQDDFAAQLGRLVDDVELRESMGKAARRRAEATLSPDRWVEAFERIVRGERLTS